MPRKTAHQTLTTQDDQTEPAIVGEVTEDGRSLILIATGPDYVVADWARRLQQLTPLFKRSDPPGALIVPATWAVIVQLAMTFRQAWQPGPRLAARIAAQFALRTNADQPGELTVAPPDGLVPRAYQVQAARMIAANGRVLLFDEQGTGKTVSAILGLVERAATGVAVAPVVCVVPASVVDSWVKAWTDWAPSWPVVAWRGPGRRKLVGSALVYVTSYDTARMDAAAIGGPLLKLVNPESMVLDEVHLIKSPHAQRSVAARRIARASRTFVGLGGTPITHDSSNLWPALEALEPHAWPSSERWIDRYCAKGRSDYGADKIIGLEPMMEPELRAALLGQHRRVAKEDVLDQLPPKIYSVRTVELPAAYRKAYDDIERQMIAELPDGGELSVMDVLTQLNFLSRLACAAADVEYTYTVDEEGNEKTHTHLKLKLPSWKVEALLEVLAERPGQPVVSFAPSAQLARLAGQAAEAEGLRVGYVLGGQAMGVRTRTVEAFQAGQLDLLCASTGAGGVGLTLTAAGTLVALQRPWSIVESMQMEDRCHRIGSEIHDVVEIIDIVAANTIDTRVRAVLYEKAGQLSELLQDPRIVRQLLGGFKVKGGKGTVEMGARK